MNAASDFLTRKVALYKFTSNGEMHLRNFRLNSAGTSLKWSSMLKRSRDCQGLFFSICKILTRSQTYFPLKVHLSEVDHIDWGEASEAYQRCKTKPSPNCAISIVQKDGSSLHLVAKDEREGRLFVLALQDATNMAYQKQAVNSSFGFNTTFGSDSGDN